jgi:hypothetical protein
LARTGEETNNQTDLGEETITDNRDRRTWYNGSLTQQEIHSLQEVMEEIERAKRQQGEMANPEDSSILGTRMR